MFMTTARIHINFQAQSMLHLVKGGLHAIINFLNEKKKKKKA